MQDFDFIILLNKRFAGTIDDREASMLDAWIGKSADNAQLAEQYQLVWNKSTQQTKHFKLDLDAEFQQLQSRIKEDERPSARIIPIGYRLMRLAAVLSFVLLAIWGYREFTTPAATTILELAQNQEKRLLELPDGTRVWLRKNASLEYPSPFQTSERRVKLVGEAYFEVSHRDGQPFRVETGKGAEVEVLGTRFNVRDMPDDTKTIVLVRNGKVQFAPNKQNKGVILEASEKAVYDRSTARIKKSKVLTFNELSWQTGGLEFVRTPLQNVITDLESYYQVNIELRNQSLRQCLHTAPMTNQSIEDVLEGLALTYHFQLTKSAPGTFILSGGVCQ